VTARLRDAARFAAKTAQVILAVTCFLLPMLIIVLAIIGAVCVWGWLLNLVGRGE